MINKLTKYLLCLVLMLGFLSPELAAQVRSSQVFLAVEISPGIGYRNLIAQDNNPHVASLIKLRDDIESPVPNIAFGLHGGLVLNPHWELSVGFRYAMKGQQVAETLSTIDPSDPLNGASMRAIERSRFVEIPVRTTYHVFTPNRRYIFSLEPYYARLDRDVSRVYITPIDEKMTSSKAVDQSQSGEIVFFGCGVQAGVQHSFSETLALRVTPSFRMNLHEISTVNTILFHWNAAVDFTLHYTL